MTTKIQTPQVTHKKKRTSKAKNVEDIYCDRGYVQILNRLHPARTNSVLVANRQSNNCKQIMEELGIVNMNEENYIKSSKDKPKLFKVKPVHLLSSFGGMGLFADKIITKGTIIGEYTGKKYSYDEFEELLSTEELNDSYAMNTGKGIVDAQMSGNFTRFINYSDTQANVFFDEAVIKGEPAILVKALRPIRKGEQLLVDYNVHDDAMSKEFFFLNASDNELSTAEHHQKYKNYYTQELDIINIAQLGMSEPRALRCTEIGKIVVTGEELPKELDSIAVNLPFIQVDNARHIIDILDEDWFTPLMVASFIGSLHNVKALVQNGANLDQQQNHSGDCALFHALRGYEYFYPDSNTHIDIMVELLKNGANPTVHDRNNQTFLHKASLSLSPDHFNHILHVIHEHTEYDLRKLFDYTNDEGHDVMLANIKSKDFEKVKLILSCYPDYFYDNYLDDENPLKHDNLDNFKQLLTHLSFSDKINFKNILSSYDLDLDLRASQVIDNTNQELTFSSPLHC